MKIITNLYKNSRDDSLYRNSIFLMLSTLVQAIFGFFFWIIVARLFKTEEVGVATTLISITTLISSFALLGLNMSIVRYLPKSNDKNEIISTSFILVTLASLLATGIFVLFLERLSPEFLFLKNNLIYLLIFTVFILVLSLGNTLDSIYMAYRVSENVLLRNIIQSVLKIVFIFPLVALGAYGIFSSFAFATITAFVVSMIIFTYRFDFKPILKINKEIIVRLRTYSIANYISGFLYQLPTLVLPVLIINHLHAKAAAYYYIDSMILNLLIIIPISTSQTLFTEGSHNESEIKNHLFKATRITILLLIPAVLISVFFGNIVLHFFGKSYEEDAFRFLQILALSSIPIAITLFGNSILRIYHKNKLLIIFNAFYAGVVLLGSYAFISYNLVALGVGWLFAQSLIAIFFLAYLYKYKIYEN